MFSTQTFTPGSTAAMETRDSEMDFLRVGDHVCLFCEEVSGYLFSELTTSSMNLLYSFEKQDKNKPVGIHNPQVVTFKIHTQNRYKLNKIYHEMSLQAQDLDLTDDFTSQLDKAKKDAENETKDNKAEQIRRHGKVVKYGDVIQLKHTFSNKFVHCGPEKLSRRGDGSYQVYLDGNNSKLAQFRILPKYKLNAEGENVCCGDHFVLESFKSPGYFLNADDAFKYYNGDSRCEMRCGLVVHEFTLTKRFATRDHDNEEYRDILWGSTVIQLHHKHLAAYVTVDNSETTAHKIDRIYLRPQELDSKKLGTGFPPQSCATFFQIIHQHSCLDGEPFTLGSQIRLQHFTTNQYLFADKENNLRLTKDPVNPRAVFKLHYMQRHGVDSRNSRHKSNGKSGFIEDFALVRIEHVITGTWLHGETEEDDIQTFTDSLVKPMKISLTSDLLYYDAFCLQRIFPSQLNDTNFMLGIRPVVSYVRMQLSQEGQPVDAMMMEGTQALLEMKSFLAQPEEHKRQKQRKTLIRELGIMEVLVRLLKLLTSRSLQIQFPHLIHSISEVFMTSIHMDTENCLYVTQFMDFFQHNIAMKDGNLLGVSMIHVLLELIRDRRDVVNKMTKPQISKIISHYRKYQHARYLEVLSCLCYCEGEPITENQIFIAEQLLNVEKTCLYNFIIKNGEIFVVSRTSPELIKLLSFSGTHQDVMIDDLSLLQEQLKLFDNLCKGRNHFCINILTNEQSFVTWETVIMALQTTNINSYVRALFCQLIITLYVDVSENTSLLESTSYTYSYDKLDITKSMDRWLDQQALFVDTSLETKVPRLQQWLLGFLKKNSEKYEEANQQLILVAWKLVHILMEYGYYSLTKIIDIFPIMIKFLEQEPRNHYYSHVKTNGKTRSTFLDIRYHILCLLDLLLDLQFRYQVEVLVATFKDIEIRESANNKHRNPIGDFLHDVHGKLQAFNWTSPKTELAKRLDNILKLSPIPVAELRGVLLKFANLVDNDDIGNKQTGDSGELIISKSLLLLRNHFKCRSRLLRAAEHSVVLMQETCCALMQDVQSYTPLLARLISKSMDIEQSKIVGAILEKFKGFCRTEHGLPEKVGQQILVNQGILKILVGYLVSNSTLDSDQEVVILKESVIRLILELLQALCCDNPSVQEHLYNHLDVFISLPYAPRELAVTMGMIFQSNPVLCERIDRGEVQSMVRLSFQHKANASSFLKVLKILLACDGDEEHINIRMKHVISKIGNDLVAQLGLKLLDMDLATKEEVLKGEHSPDLLSYFINITNVIALTMKDTDAVKTFSSSVYGVKDVLAILANPSICCNAKRPFVKLLHWVLIHSCEQITQLQLFWDFLKLVSQQLERIHTFINQDSCPVVEVSEDTHVTKTSDDIRQTMAADIYFFIDVILPLMRTLSDGDKAEITPNSTSTETFNKIVQISVKCFPLVVARTDNKRLLNSIKNCLQPMMQCCHYGDAEITDLMNILDTNFAARYPGQKNTEEGDAHVMKEILINKKLQNFIANCKSLKIPVNTIESQLGCKERKYAKLEYTEISSGKQLPLSDEFQEHVNAFINPEFTLVFMRYRNVRILIKQLVIVASVIDTTSVNNQMLAHSCLQILRALLHNIIILLPEDIFTSKDKKKKYSIRVNQLQELQALYVEHGLVHLVMTLIGTQNQSIFRESLALLECMLFGASQDVQNSALDFFETTKEEALFMIISDFLKYSANFMKERRSLVQKINRTISRSGPAPTSKQRTKLFVSFRPVKKSSKVGINLNDADMEFESTVAEREQDTDQHDLQGKLLRMNTCTVQLILKVVTKLAEGHHTGLQDYLREQPDNFKSFNIIAAVTHYLGQMYTTIQEENIALATDIFQALREMCLGNQKNRLVILDNKIIDCINYILKQKTLEEVSTSALLLKKSISSLLVALVEENSPKGLKVAQDIAETLDIESLLITMRNCKEVKKDDGLATLVGHHMYVVFARMSDVIEDKSLIKDLMQTYRLTLAWYSHNVPSVEIIKDGHLQRIYFAMLNKRDIRADLKQSLKWNVDRSSPTNKIIDFMQWAHVIIKDYYYQEKVLSNWLGRVIVKGRKVWDILVILISFIINLYMLICWVRPASDARAASNGTQLLYFQAPELAFSPHHYKYGMWTCRILHNLMTAILVISYFVSQHPSLPRPNFRLLSRFKRNKNDSDSRTTKSEVQIRHNYNTKLFSSKTAYYLVMFILSIIGTVLSDYAFAFHLLHLVEVNTLLQGVIRAITKNGRSLLWVAILGGVILYIYGLIGFAVFSHVFERGDQLYCNTLYECTATVTTYGLIGLLGENILLQNSDTFIIFLVWSLYQISFFIFFTTIGLNIIFGIIVDTFSELRDLKWRAEKDMQDFCFICSLPSYDFEHHSKGFFHHVHEEHNMWTYIYYFIYLSTTNRSEYTALDHYVAEQRQRGMAEFIPMNRALSLSNGDQGTKDKLEELRQDIAFLKQKQLQMEREQKVQQQNQEQQNWKLSISQTKSATLTREEATDIK